MARASLLIGARKLGAVPLLKRAVMTLIGGRALLL